MRVRITDIQLLPGADAPLLPDAEVQIENGAIVYAGAREQAPAFTADDTVRGDGCLCMPGLVNAHAHSAMTLLRGVGGDLPLDRWLNEQIFPAEHRLTADFARAGMNLALLEQLRFGVTTTNDMYMFPEISADCADKAGARMLICNACVDFNNGGGQLAEAIAFYRAYNGYANGRVRASIALHAEYTSNPPFVRKVAEARAEYGSIMHVHVSETAHEVAGCYERHGISPVRYFHDLGLFSGRTIAAHCVAVDDEDIAILAEDGVSVAHCPVSNLKLGSGVAPVPKMLAAGVRVALGTDGVASNNNLNLWEEVKLMGILHKGVTGDPTVISPAQALAAATVEGARALGFDDVGLLAPGYRADLILLDTRAAHVTPRRDALDCLVYAQQGCDVRMTMVDGRILYKDGEYRTLDRERVLREAEAAARVMA